MEAIWENLKKALVSEAGMDDIKFENEILKIEFQELVEIHRTLIFGSAKR